MEYLLIAMGACFSILLLVSRRRRRSPQESASASEPEEVQRFLDVDEAGALELSRREDLVIVDVRTRHEVASGRIAGSLHLPLEDFERRWPELPRDRPILLYCAMGIRSAAAAQFLGMQGFTEVYNLGQGFHAWTGRVERGEILPLRSAST